MNINLLNGDCLEQLKSIPDGSVDLVLTDPPYGMSFQSNFRKQKHKKIENDTELSWMDEWVDEIHRVLADNTHFYAFCSFHNIDIFKQKIQKKFTVKNILVWEKNNTSMGDLEGDFAPKIEFVIFAHKGRRAIYGKRDPNIFRFDRTGNKHHPTEKPVDMMEYLISKSTKEGETVLDTFMGAGATGVACKLTNRNFIGIELEEQYFNTAKKRINETLAKQSTDSLFSFE